MYVAFLCQCFLERVRENTFFQKRFSRNLIKTLFQTKKRIWFTNPLFALVGN